MHLSGFAGMRALRPSVIIVGAVAADLYGVAHGAAAPPDVDRVTIVAGYRPYALTPPRGQHYMTISKGHESAVKNTEG